MNKKKTIGLAAVVAAATTVATTLAQPANAASSLFDVSVEVNNPTGYMPGATVINFDDPLPTGVTLDGGAIVSGDQGGIYAEPELPGGGNYLTVGPSGDTAGPSTLTFSFSNDLDYYGIYWGSVDTYNTLEFLQDGTVIATYTGTDVLNPANGFQGQGGSAYVNFMATDSSGFFDQVRLTSTSFAFESDNHAFKVVPTPAAVLPGLAGMAAGVFRKKKKEGEGGLANA